MSTVKKQHYVPQFYLRNFSRDNKRIFVFDKFRQKEFASNVHDIANENYFYDLSEQHTEELIENIHKKHQEEPVDPDLFEKMQEIVRDTQMIEEHLGRLETRFANVLENALETLEKRNRFKARYRPEIALMAAVQFLRTREQRESMVELVKKTALSVMPMVEKISEIKGYNLKSEDLDITFDEEDTVELHKMTLLDEEYLVEIASILLNHIWIIGKNETSEPLYTSDNPVCKRANKSDDWRSNAGIASPGIEIVFPLTPKYILTMYERSFFAHLAHKDGKIVYLKPDDVSYFNRFQVNLSYRQIYGIKNSFELAKQMCIDNPNLTKEKSRWDVR